MDYQRERSIADNMIRKYGAKAVLRRDDGDRPCWVFISNYSAQEKIGKLVNQTDRRALVSPIGLDIEPDSEQDRLVTFDPLSGAEKEVLRIVAPIGKLAPADIIVYWELQVRR